MTFGTGDRLKPDDAEGSYARRGPYPLWLHIGLSLGYLGATNGQDLPHTVPAFPPEMLRMLRGIQRYHLHPFRRPPPEYTILWQKGQTRLLRKTEHGYQEGGRGAMPRRAGSRHAVVLIPSMINGFEIMDLIEHRSFTNYLARECGLDVYIIDWGHPCSDPGLADWDSAITHRLLPALHVLKEQHAQSPVTGVGYCMGGMFLAAALALAPRLLHSAVFMATPWHFKAQDYDFAGKARTYAHTALRYLALADTLPLSWLQTLFASIDPSLALRKFSAFADMDESSPEYEVFVAVEDWVNSGNDLPAGIARPTFRDWYIANAPYELEWKVDGKIVNPGVYQLPSLVCAPIRDRLVSYMASATLASVIPDATLLSPDSGHIGMMVGREARHEIWQPVAEWIRAQCG